MDAPSAPVIDAIPIPGEAKLVGLRMPRPAGLEPGEEFPAANLDFGPASIYAPDHAAENISFRLNDDGSGYAVVREDHPALPDLLRKYPMVQLLQSEGPKTYACDDCDKEFKGLAQLRTHRRIHA